MYIEWTDQALTKITEKINGANGYLLLKYDTDGCGCVVDGVTSPLACSGVRCRF